MNNDLNLSRMATKAEVEFFLKELKQKISLYQKIVFLGRVKNAQTLLDLEITPLKRNEIIKQINLQDYSEGPIDEKMMTLPPMWVFGKEVKRREVYIKISLGKFNNDVVCISFHIAEHPMNYPFK